MASAASGGAAFGDNSVATGSLATALGPGAQATFANSTALGAGAVATRANQMMLGTTTATYTMPGITSAASLSAQSGPVKFVTSDAAGNLAVSDISASNITNITNNITNLQANVANITNNITNLQANVATLQANVATLQTNVARAFEGTAIAIALGGGFLPDNKTFAISTNWGTFLRRKRNERRRAYARERIHGDQWRLRVRIPAWRHGRPGRRDLCLVRPQPRRRSLGLWLLLSLWQWDSSRPHSLKPRPSRRSPRRPPNRRRPSRLRRGPPRSTATGC